MAKPHTNRKRAPGAPRLAKSGALLHWLGMLAMVVGLFAPLATAEAAVTVMTPEQALMKAAQEPFSSDTADFQRVALVGDFQQQLGCGDWDANCGQSQLTDMNGFWTGVFGVAPGAYNWELVAIDWNGAQFSIAEGQVNVADGQTGIYAEFNSATRDNNVSATTGVAFANGSFGDVALAPDGDGYVANALNISTPGWVDMQVTVNGAPVPTGAEFQEGVSRVTFDATGNITNVEHRGFAEVTVQRVDADGNPLPGSCFVLDGSSQSRGCDADGSPDGSSDGATVLRFPGGFQPGTYTLRETRPADGAEPLADQQVDVQQGTSTIEARSEGEPTPETGDLVVLRQDTAGTPVGGACFEITNANGEVVASACDADGDIPDDGRIGLLGVPAGDYTLSETQTPEGVEPASDVAVSVFPNQVTEQPVQSAAIVIEEPTEEVTEVPTEEATEAPTEEVTEVPTEEVTEVPTEEATETPTEVAIEEPTAVGRIVVYREDNAGNPVGGSCFEAIDSNGQVVAANCDEDGIAPDDGSTGVVDVPVGDYTLVESRVPEGYQQAPDTPVTVTEGDVILTVMSEPVPATEEATEEPTEEVTEPPVEEPPVDTPAQGAGLEVTYNHDETQPNACIEIESRAAIGGMEIPYACDNGPNDEDPALGSIRMQSLQPGEFDVVVYEGPTELVESAPEPVTLQEGQIQPLSLASEAPVTTSFTVSAMSEGVGVPGVTFQLDGTETTATTDDSGNAVFSDVTPGDRSVTIIDVPGTYNAPETTTQPITVAGDGSSTMSFELTRATTSFTVSAMSEGIGVPGVTFQLDGTETTATTDDSGNAVFSDVTPGERSVTIIDVPGTHNVPETTTQPITVAGDGSSTMSFELTRATTSFTVSAMSEGVGVPGVTFQLDGTETTATTDESGNAVFSNVLPGEHSVTMTGAPDGFNLSDPASQPITVAGDGSSTMSFELTRATTSFTVTVMSEGVGVPGVTLRLQPAVSFTTSGVIGVSSFTGMLFQLDDTANTATTDENGVATFSGVLPGEYTVTVIDVPDGFNLPDPATLPIMVTGDGSASLDFQITETTVDIVVTTVDQESGEPLRGACYTLDGGDPQCDEEAGEGEGGQVVFEGETPGEKTLSMQTAPDGFVPAADQVLPADTTNVEVGVQQSNGGIVVSVVTGEEGATTPVPGACISIDGGEPLCDVDDGNDGVFTFLNLAEGQHTVAISQIPDDFESLSDGEETISVDVVAGVDTPVTFNLTETPEIRADLNVSVFFDSEEGDPAQGVCLIATSGNEGEAPLTACDDDNDGVVTFGDLLAGTYLIDLDTENYDGPPINEVVPVSATVPETGEAGEASLILTLLPTTGTLEITVTDGSASVPGACFDVAGRTVCDDETGDTNLTAGVVTIADIEQGENITVSMSRVPTGYQQPADQNVSITAGQTTSIQFTLEAQEEPGSVTVSTVDGEGSALHGACYRLVQGSTVIGPFCDSEPADGDVLFENVPAGEYRLEQTTRPSNRFETPTPVNVTVNAGENTDVEVTMTQRNGQLRITTVDADDTGVVLEGACYRILGEPGFGPFCDADDGNSDGIVRFTNVPAGEYELEQTVSTAGFDPAANRTVTINPGGSTQITVLNSRVEPPAETGTLVIIPLDPSGNPVAGGCYQVFDGDRPVTNRICDNADDQPARITITDLPVGDLTLRELLAPSPDWQIAADRTVAIANGETTTVEVPHEFKPGNVVIQAVNSVDLPLRGACFTLSDTDGTELCTNNAGQITVTGLTPGSRELTQTKAPFGYKLNETPREVIVHPGQTTTVRVVFENEPPPNTGTVQVQKFYCPAGEEGERTRFLGGAQGNQELKQTVGCNPGVAHFTMVAEDGSTESNAEFSTNEEGRAQLTAVEGIYLLTETDPDMPGNSAARLRVGVGQMTTVIVINYVAPPAPAPVTINVEGYTCAPGFNGSSFVDFADSCMAPSQLTNQITVRAEAEARYKRSTGDTGELGKTTFNDLPAGNYTIWAERPHTVPVSYMFCGADVNNPGLKTVNGTVNVALESGSSITCRVFQVPPLFDADHGAIQVHKFNCPITERQRGYDYQNECARATEPVPFEIQVLDPKSGAPVGDPVRVNTNSDGIVQFPMLQPGTYKLVEVDSEWCFAQSNSVDAQGDVVVQNDKLSEVWVYNCVGTKSPPNTGSGDAAGLSGPDGGISPMSVLPNLIWPTILLAGWMVWRDRKQA